MVTMSNCGNTITAGEIISGMTDTTLPVTSFPELKIAEVLTGPSPGGYCRDKEPRQYESYEERGTRSSQSYEERESRSDRDREQQTEERTQRGGTAATYTPGVTFLRQYSPQEERYEERYEDRDYDRNRNPRPPDRDHPWYEFRDMDVLVEYFLMGPCPRWEEGRCILDFVDAQITIYKNDRKQTDLKTTGTCGCI